MATSDLTAQLLLGQATRQRVSPRAAMAQRLMATGADTSPVYSPMAALARALTGGIGGYMAGQARDEDQAAQDGAVQRVQDFENQRRERWASELAGLDGNPVPEGQEGPSRPAVTGDARMQALAQMAGGGNQLAAAQIPVMQTQQQQAFQERMAREQREHSERLARVAAGNRVTWSDVRDEDGNLIGQRSSQGQFNPIADTGLTPARAQTSVMRLAEGYGAGTLTPQQERQFEASLAVIMQPRISGYDPATGQAIVTRPEAPPFVAAALQARQGRAQPQVVPQAAPSGAPTPNLGALPPEPGAPLPVAPAAPAASTASTPALPAPPPFPGAPGVTVQQIAPPRPGADVSANDRTRLRNLEVEAAGLRDAMEAFRETRRNAPMTERLAAAAGMPTSLSTSWSNAALLAKGEALYNLGVLNGPDLQIIQRTLSDPATMRGLFTGMETTDAQIDQILNLMDRRIETARQQFGGGVSIPGPGGVGTASPPPRSPPPPPGFELVR